MRRALRKYLFFAALVLCVFTDDAHAYLDPGTGSMLMQALAAVLLAGAGVWYALKNKIRSFFYKKNDTHEDD